MMPDFQKARKIWLKGLSEELNVQAGFLCELPGQEPLILKITGSTLYRIFWNGELLQYGPARGPHGYCRIDHVPLPPLSGGRKKVMLAIEVAGYNCESYYTLKMPSFLQAEVRAGNEVITYTGDENIRAKRLTARHQNVLRYSYQRTFTETYTLEREEAQSPWHGKMPDTAEETEILDLPVKYLDRGVSPASLILREDSRILESGKFALNPDKIIKKEDYPTFISLDYQGIKLPGFPVEELSLPVHETISSMEQTEKIEKTRSLTSGEYTLFEFPINNNGFIKFPVTAEENSMVMLIFDEKLIEGRIKRNCRPTCNFICLELQASGRPYDFISFETYGFKYLEVALIRGKIYFENPGLIEYGTTDYHNCHVKIEDKELQKIFDASLETYRQNTLDVFMDCPTRERAGWLCDSYFTAQSAQLFSRKCDVEKIMLENYIIREPDIYLPPRVPAMCYPADHINTRFIPQWAMWYVAELEGYFQRNPLAEKEDFREITVNLLSWCQEYENEYGLLEDLPSWNFVEWSKANEWVDGINYPTNMLYSRILKLAGKWYGLQDYLAKAALIDQFIIGNSWNGELFMDHSLRDGENKIIPTSHTSEVCQYSAYAHGLISVEDPRFTSLWDKVMHLFGPRRKENNERPDIAFANAFIGNYLRMEILLNEGKYSEVLEETKGYFLKMAELTGTLWEHDNKETGSLNHGFASYIGLAIIHCLGGIQKLDYRNKTVTIDVDPGIKIDMELEWDTPFGMISVSRNTVGSNLSLIINIPEAFQVVIKERSQKYSLNHYKRNGYSILEYLKDTQPVGQPVKPE